MSNRPKNTMHTANRTTPTTVNRPTFASVVHFMVYLLLLVSLFSQIYDPL